MHQSDYQEYDVKCHYVLQDDALDDNPCAECNSEGQAAHHADDWVPQYQDAAYDVAQADDEQEEQAREEIGCERGILQKGERGTQRVVDV